MEVPWLLTITTMSLNPMSQTTAVTATSDNAAVALMSGADVRLGGGEAGDVFDGEYHLRRVVVVHIE